MGRACKLPHYGHSRFVLAFFTLSLVQSSFVFPALLSVTHSLMVEDRAWKDSKRYRRRVSECIRAFLLRHDVLVSQDNEEDIRYAAA